MGEPGGDRAAGLVLFFSEQGLKMDELRVGLGFRFALAEELLASETSHASFLEIAPENYLGVGGRRRRLLDEAAERWPVVCHGLCGDLAGRAPLDLEMLGQLRVFLRELNAQWYSDHLCLTHIGGAEVHELIPLPFNEETVDQVVDRVVEVEEFLGLPMAVENVSAYGRMPEGSMSEPEFVTAVIERADCKLLLDVNNVYVNAVNFGFDPREYIRGLPLERVVEIHMAGHTEEEEGLLIDTHARPIEEDVYDLFRYTLEVMPHRPPVLLERDGNIPPLVELEEEMARLLEIIEAVDET